MADYDKEAYAEQARIRAQELTEKLETGMKDFVHSDKYTDYLKAMSVFHSYSSRNIMLINMQKPGATRIASVALWKKEFNRFPKKGEKALYILAPMINKETEKVLMEKIDPDTKTPMRDKDGNIIM